MRKAKSDGREWFVVYSDYGYFTGLANGGQLQWSLDEKEAKPLDGIQKYHKIKQLAPQNIDVIFEYI
jgi:hypothetical protein